MPLPLPARRARAAAAATLLLPAVASAQGAPADTAAPAVTVDVDAFVDSYVAYDVNAPANLDRQYTTQPARHGEFNVNLAFIGATVASGRLRGRLALQAGTSVQSNYAGEPTLGAVSGPELARFLQEAYAGYHVTDELWIDGGVFFSNMGMESWISADNAVYTRSLVADFSPYYSTGVRAIWQATPTLTARLDVMNGWQIISESNTDKSVGARLDWTPRPGTTLSYYNYVGNEPGGRLRVFNGVGAALAPSERLSVVAQLDVGAQERAGGGEDDVWVGGTVFGRWWLTPVVGLTARVEGYRDRGEVIIATPDGRPGFDALGGSLGVDVRPGGADARFLWRTELRGFDGAEPVFQDDDAALGYTRTSGFLVTSLSLRM